MVLLVDYLLTNEREEIWPSHITHTAIYTSTNMYSKLILKIMTCIEHHSCNVETNSWTEVVLLDDYLLKEKSEEIWPRPLTHTAIPTCRKFIKRQSNTTTKTPLYKTFDYRKTVGKLRTASSSAYNYSTIMVNLVYKPNVLTQCYCCVSKAK